MVETVSNTYGRCVPSLRNQMTTNLSGQQDVRKYAIVRVRISASL